MSTVNTPTFRVSYPNVFKPKLNELSKKLEYSIVALFDKGADLKPLQAKMLAVCKEKFGEGATIAKAANGTTYEIKIPGKSSITLKNWPLRDQGEKEKDGVLPQGHEKGAIFMNLKSNNKPGLINSKNEDILEESDFYAGCYARAAVTCYYYDQAGNRGFGFGLQALQKVKDGDSLTGRIKAQDVFQPIEELDATGSAEDLFGS